MTLVREFGADLSSVRLLYGTIGVSRPGPFSYASVLIGWEGFSWLKALAWMPEGIVPFLSLGFGRRGVVCWFLRRLVAGFSEC